MAKKATAKQKAARKKFAAQAKKRTGKVGKMAASRKSHKKKKRK